jgi:hypothetical protein
VSVPSSRGFSTAFASAGLDKIVVAARIGKAEAAAFLKKLLREISSSFFFSLSISHQLFACSQQTLIKNNDMEQCRFFQTTQKRRD